MSEPVTNQPVIEETQSIAEHASQFGPEAVAEANSAPNVTDAPAEPQTEEQKAAHHAAQQKRDEVGKFREGKLRQKSHEAKSRIDALTGRAKAAEERAQTLERELQTLRLNHAPAAQIQQAERRVEQAERRVEAADPSDPEPREDDPEFESDWTKYLEARARWASRDEFRRQQTQHEQRQQQQQHLKTWQGRLAAARSEIADYEAVAFSPTTIQPGSIADDFIMNDDAGPKILYHLQKNPQERDALLQMGPREQAKALSLLSQRFEASNVSGSAGTTGSVARRPVSPLPKPPNPVRTEATRSSGIPPSTDGSLSMSEHRRAFARAR